MTTLKDRKRVTSLERIRSKYGKKLAKISPDDRNRAFKAYIEVGRKLQMSSPQAYNLNNMMQAEQGRLFNMVSPVHIGKLMMFFYDAKTKADLPYWDRAPLIIPFNILPDGFMGINFHYLHPMARALLLDFLLRDAQYAWFRDPNQAQFNAFARRRINMTYRGLQAMCQSQLFKPCVKRYLYRSKQGTHVKSRFYLIEPEDWFTFMALPIEQFEKASRTNVWEQSMRKVFA